MFSMVVQEDVEVERKRRRDELEAAFK